MTHIRDQLEAFLVERGVPLEQHRPAPPADEIRTFGVTPSTNEENTRVAWIVTYDERANIGRQFRDSLALMKLYSAHASAAPPSWRWTPHQHPVSWVYYWEVEDIPDA